MLHGLVSDPTMNGRVGLLRAYDAASGRWQLNLMRPERLVTVREKNLRRPTPAEAPPIPSSAEVGALHLALDNAIMVLIDERDWSLVAAGVKTDDDDGELWYAMIHNRERASSNIHMHPTFFAGRVYMPCTTLSHPNSMRIRVRRIDLKTINGPGVLAAVRRVFTA